MSIKPGLPFLTVMGRLADKESSLLGLCLIFQPGHPIYHSPAESASSIAHLREPAYTVE